MTPPPPATKPSVLLVGHPAPDSIPFAVAAADHPSRVNELGLPVAMLAVSRENLKDSTALLDRLHVANPHAQTIVISSDLSVDEITTLIRHGPIFRFLNSWEDPQIVEAVKSAHALSQFEQQQNVPSSKQGLQSEKVLALTRELEGLAEKHEKNLHRAQKRVMTINRKVDSLYKALLAVHAAKSIGEVESLLFSALEHGLELSWVKIFFQDSENLDVHLSRLQGLKIYKAPLALGLQRLGWIVFARPADKPFTKAEDELLLQVTESVALAIDRLAKLEQAENLKRQWDSTFDSISEPLCLTDEKFQILRTNRAFLNVTGLASTKLVGQNAFSVFVGHDPTARMERAAADRFVIQRQPTPKSEARFYEVTTQRIDNGDEPIVLTMFRDVTEQKRIERQIFESAKMAELGTIGSSIAHELNNPLGGIMSFLQLIKMDLKDTDPIREDIIQMEAAARRCKEIVESLLIFSRQQEAGEAAMVDLRAVMQQALKIIELQTRSLGIKVEFNPPVEAIDWAGHYNLLAQAFSHTLQNAVEAVSEKLQQSPGFDGRIKVEMRAGPDGAVITIEDNGIGIRPEHQSKILNPLFSTKDTKQGLGLTLAYKIVADHRGQLEISSQPNIGTLVKISFLKV